MKILICDDEIKYLEDLKRHIEVYMKSHFLPYKLFSTTSPMDVINRNEPFDLAFLDIQMNYINGISLAKKLKERNRRTVIFFVTSFPDYQDDAMDLRPFRFFEKPFQVDRLYTGLDRAMEYIDKSYVDVYMRDKESQKRIAVDDIIYICKDNKQYIMTTKTRKYAVKEDIDYWEEKLPSRFFYRVHKSFLINIHYVDSYKYTELFLLGNVRVAIASRKQSAFHKYWFEYMGRY